MAAATASQVYIFSEKGESGEKAAALLRLFPPVSSKKRGKRSRGKGEDAQLVGQTILTIRGKRSKKRGRIERVFGLPCCTLRFKRQKGKTKRGREEAAVQQTLAPCDPATQ